MQELYCPGNFRVGFIMMKYNYCIFKYFRKLQLHKFIMIYNMIYIYNIIYNKYNFTVIHKNKVCSIFLKCFCLLWSICYILSQKTIYQVVRVNSSALNMYVKEKHITKTATTRNQHFGEVYILTNRNP